MPTLKHSLTFVTFITGLLLLSSCSLKPIANTQQQTYVLNPHIPTTVAEPSQLILLVATTKASQAFDTVQMAYVKQPYQLAFFSYNQWADTPAQMLYPLLIQTLQNTGHFRAVIGSANSTQYNVVLTTRLLELQQSFLQKPSQIHLKLRAQLINNNTHQIIATQQFNIVEPTIENNPYGGVIAANKATEKLLRQISQFCLANTQSFKFK